MSAYDLYLRAHPLYFSFNRAKMAEALDLLNRAIDLDPEFGPALALAGACHHIILLFEWSEDPEANRRQALIWRVGRSRPPATTPSCSPGPPWSWPISKETRMLASP